MNDSRIVRNRAKILSTINNAQCALEMINEYGSLANFLWSFEPPSKKYKNVSAIPSQTDDSKKLSAELKKKGWSFEKSIELFKPLETKKQLFLCKNIPFW